MYRDFFANDRRMEEMGLRLRRAYLGRTVKFREKYNITPEGTIARVAKICTPEFKTPTVVVQWQNGTRTMQRTLYGDEADRYLKVIG